MIGLACAPHEEGTPAITVQPGAAARAMALLGHVGPNDPRFGRKSEGDAGADVAPEKAQGKLLFSCLEARGAFKALGRVPCEVAVVGIGATPAEELDLVSETGKIALPLPAGTYRVTTSRGLEYGRVSWEVDVAPGRSTWGPNEGATVLRRVVDTRGYLASDLRASALPADGGAAGGAADDPREDVVEEAAEGVEVEAVLGDGVSSVIGPVVRAVQEAKLDDQLAVVEVRGTEFNALDAWDDPAAFLARLASKQPATGVALSPAQVPVRTYVRVDDDGSPGTWSPAREADFTRSLRERRDVVLTTGPFLRVTTNGGPIGGVARVNADKDVEVRVHVECAPWVAVDRVSIARASGVAVEPQSVTLRPLPSDARAADVVFHLRATVDDAFVVTADSSAHPSADDPVNASRARTGAIWIDADGDGESLGRR
jgi:hypothetical protein